MSDEHMSEYIGDYAARLAWLTGFGGSVGNVAVLAHEAAIFVDGRYTVQVREQVDGRLFQYRSVPEDSPAEWVAQTAPEGARIGFDPWLHTHGWVEATRAALAERGVELVALDSNPIDAVWADRPAPSPALAQVQPAEQAGRSSAQKREEIGRWLADNRLDAAVISALDSIAWTLNIRGADVTHTPVALSYLVAHRDGTAELFIAADKVTPELTRHLGNAVTIRDRADFEGALGTMAGKRVAVDPQYGVEAIVRALEGGDATAVMKRDPAILPKAIKNAAEARGHRDAQARDAAAVSRFLAWIEAEAPRGTVDELAAVAKLHAFREDTGLLRDTSFDTISAAAGHAALPHYRVDEDSNITIPPSSIYLCDSGGQYPDGTTDITRTVWVGPGEPSAEMKDRFTRVLKGHIAIDAARFPARTNGGQIDALARQFLWAAGVDYAHGTGHGVGSYLAVHEGPQRIAKSGGAFPGTAEPLLEGMILSNEPGYYKAGEFGIRIENLVLAVPVEIEGAEHDVLGFETLTFVPIDRALIEPSLLTDQERAWLDDYHARVRDIVAPQLDGAALDWLERHTKPL